MNKIEEILKKININIPNPPKPVGNYAAFSKYEKLIFISGQLPITTDGKIISGKVMKDVSLEQAQKAAEMSILNALGHDVEEEKKKLGTPQEVSRYARPEIQCIKQCLGSATTSTHHSTSNHIKVKNNSAKV